MNIQELFIHILNLAENKNYPDIHFNTGYYPIIRNTSWDIIEVSEIHTPSQDQGKEDELIRLNKLSHTNLEDIIEHILWKENANIFEASFEIDGSYQHKETLRYRVNCYKDSKGNSIAMRTIPHEIPSIESLGLWDQVKELCKRSKWLVLVTGPTGSGKSTNLAAMIDFINTNYKKHIITIEDPIEFVFQNKDSLINQREVWIHTKSFANAMKACLREDPDVIMLGEMRDPETIKAAITLAETGHLVFSTLHTNDTVQSIDRIVDVFPAGQQDQIRMQLAMSLAWVVAQRLLPRSDTDERIASREILINNDAVRNLIIWGKTHQLYSVIEIGQKQGMVLMDSYLIALYKKWFIDKETLEAYVRDSENVELLQ